MQTPGFFLAQLIAQAGDSEFGLGACSLGAVVYVRLEIVAQRCPLITTMKANASRVVLSTAGGLGLAEYCAAQPLASLFAHSGQDVGVNRIRDRGGGVPEQVAHNLGRNASGEHERRGRVP